MLKELKLTSQKGDATLVMRTHVRADWDGQSVVQMSIGAWDGHYIGAGLALEDVKALVKPGAGVRTTPFSREVYVGSSLASAGGTGGKSHTLFHYPAPWEKTRQTIIDWLNAAIAEFDTKKEPPMAITPTSHTITDSDGDSVTFSASGKAAADFVEKSMSLSKAEPEAVVEPVFKFAVGDRVKIVGNPTNLGREPEVGREGTVTGVRDSYLGYGDQFSVKPERGTTWWYSASALEKIEESKPAVTMRLEFKVGDRVECIEGEVGQLDLGRVYEVTDYDHGGAGYVKVKGDGAGSWWRLAERFKPAPAPAPAKTAVPVFGPVGVVAHAHADAEAIQRAADALSSAFAWCATAEGDDFWRAIHNRLLAMADAARTPARRPDADYKSACPVGYETLAMAMLRRGKPDDATVSLGTRVARRAADRGIDRVWVEAPPVAAGETDKVRAYPSMALGFILDDLGIDRA